MERLEEAQGELTRAQDEQQHIEARLGELAAARDEAAAAISKDLEAATSERVTALEGIPEDLLGLYERIREKQSVGAAELRARQCGGCQLRLNPADLAVIAKAPIDEVVRCEECSRILVRTAESRSEEHTSELQSLMRISYAVFCLKKKT